MPQGNQPLPLGLGLLRALPLGLGLLLALQLGLGFLLALQLVVYFEAVMLEERIRIVLVRCPEAM